MGRKASLATRMKRIGINHPLWKGGTDKLSNYIRYISEGKMWIKEVFKRDGFKCQICGSNKYLKVHHKKSFSSLVKEFLKQYNQFSLFEDRETFIRLSISYAPFWDISNGVTMCEKCRHKFHLIYGTRGDNTIEQYNEFVNSILNRCNISCVDFSGVSKAIEGLVAPLRDSGD